MSAGSSAAHSHEILDRLAETEARGRRKALLLAWGSVVVAAILLAGLILGSGAYLAGAYKELAKANEQRDEANNDLERIKKETTTTSADLKVKQDALDETVKKLEAVQAALDAKTAESAALVQARDEAKSTLRARVYIQIVDNDDREWVQRTIRPILVNAGLVVPVIGYVPAAATFVPRTDVRYYKRPEEPGAQRIVDLLKSVGVDAQVTYLHLDDNTSVRENHYELWFAPGSRNR